MQIDKISVALVAFVCLISTSAHALKLRCTSSASILCIAKQCPEDDRGNAEVKYSLDSERGIIVRHLSIAERATENTFICDITWQKEREGGFSNTVYDATYVCNEDYKFPDRGIFNATEMSDGEIHFTDAFMDLGLEASAGLCPSID